MHGLNSLSRLNRETVERARRDKANAPGGEAKVYPTIKLNPDPHGTIKRIMDGAKG